MVDPTLLITTFTTAVFFFIGAYLSCFDFIGFCASTVQKWGELWFFNPVISFGRRRACWNWWRRKLPWKMPWKLQWKHVCMEFHIDFHLFSFRTLIWACAFLCENKRLRNAIHGLTFAWCYLHAFSSMFIYGHYVLMPRIFPHVTRMSWPFLLGPHLWPFLQEHGGACRGTKRHGWMANVVFWPRRHEGIDYI